MDEYLSEKEQIDAFRSWWREYGTYVILGFVVASGSAYGVYSWNQSQEQTRVDASMRFEALAEEVANNRLDAAEAVAESMYSEFPETIYADQARLAMTRLYMDQGRDQNAAETLEALVNNGNSDELKMVARLRLAKVYLYQNKAQEAIDLLTGYEESGFATRYAEAIGDAHFALGDYAAAEASWLLALETDDSNQLVDTTLVQMKLGDLPSGEVAETPAPTVPDLNDAESATLPDMADEAEDAGEPVDEQPMADGENAPEEPME